MAAYWEPRPVYRQLMKPSRAHLAASVSQFAHLFRTLGVGQTLQFVGASRFIGWRRRRKVRSQLEGVSKVIVSGKSVSATCVIDGSPAAVIGGRTFTDLANTR